MAIFCRILGIWLVCSSFRTKAIIPKNHHHFQDKEAI